MRHDWRITELSILWRSRVFRAVQYMDVSLLFRGASQMFRQCSCARVGHAGRSFSGSAWRPARGTSRRVVALAADDHSAIGSCLTAAHRQRHDPAADMSRSVPSDPARCAAHVARPASFMTHGTSCRSVGHDALDRAVPWGWLPFGLARRLQCAATAMTGERGASATRKAPIAQSRRSAARTSHRADGTAPRA